MQQIILFVIITISYIVKFIIYRHLMSLDEFMNANLLAAGYISCIAASMLLASFSMFERKRVVSISLMLIMDVWMLANCIYTEANNVWMDWLVIVNANQIRGFEDSILSYLKWAYLLFPAISALTIYFTFVFPVKQQSSSSPLKKIGWVLLSSALLYSFSWAMRLPDMDETISHLHKERLITKTHSPAANLLIIIAEAVKEELLQRNAAKPLTNNEKQILSAIYTSPAIPNPPQGHLVFILVESFESWALKATDIYGNPVCPNLVRYISEHDLLYSDNLHTQQIYGRSGDGQLITQTGMLPVSHGITCIRFGDNVYPNFAHFFDDGVILNPFPKVWNQAVTTYSYGYKRLREPRNHTRENDSIIMEKTRKELERAKIPICVLAITISTHTPFNFVPRTMELSDSYSLMEKKYLHCARYMDAQVGRFLAWADTAKTMQNATIVITADHNHFPKKNGQGLCPLIIRSPYITHSIYIPQSYQMDIFPSVLHAINQRDYFWHGFGIDLLQSPLPVRLIDETDAYSLSEKLIRTNYFSPQSAIK